MKSGKKEVEWVLPEKGGGKRGGPMYTHVTKCKNNKAKERMGKE
jgi:hypothetical protein